MRILLVSDSYPPLIGGATRAGEQLARQLTSRGHTVTVATAYQRGMPATSRDGTVEIARLRGVVSRFPQLSADDTRYTPPPFPDPELIWRLRRLIKRTRPDVVHSYGWLTYSCVAAMMGQDVPLLMSARDYGMICAKRTLVRNGGACEGPALTKCLACAGNFYGQPKGAVAVLGVLGGRIPLRKKISAIHSPSRYAQAMMRSHLLQGVDIPDVVLPDFREDDETGDPDEEILRGLPREPYILYVGALRRIKGIGHLLDAYAQLALRPPLVLIGGRAPDSLPSFPEGVTVVEDVPHDTVMAAWDRALFGVAPSVVPETLGNVVHEAMSRGRPVIGTSPGGHADMIVDGTNGLLVPGGDTAALTAALDRLIRDQKLREQMGKAARSTARDFTAQVVMPRFESLYETVAGM